MKKGAIATENRAGGYKLGKDKELIEDVLESAEIDYEILGEIIQLGNGVNFVFGSDEELLSVEG